MTTDNGAEARFASDEITLGEVATLIYDLGGDEFTATIHWGDNSTSRVRGSGSINHNYNSADTYSVGLEVDGFESFRVGFIEVIEVIDSQSRDNRDSDSKSNAVFTQQLASCYEDSNGLSSSSDTMTVNGDDYLVKWVHAFGNTFFQVVLNNSAFQSLSFSEVPNSPCAATATISRDGISFEFTPNASGQYTVTATF